ncbi:MAG: arylamine N-acetyltransferase family protein, partial [Caulobacteraceae bacterium]
MWDKSARARSKSGPRVDIDAYLERIGLSERPPATLGGLTALHHAHLRAVPYENLEVQLGRPVSIERPAIFEKIVARRRGGWCYEMNGIFGWALGQLGFRVRRATGAVGAPGDHLVLRVELEEGLYLADVGVCTGPLDTIPVREGGFAAGGFTYRVESLEEGRWRFHNDPLAFPPSFEFD